VFVCVCARVILLLCLKNSVLIHVAGIRSRNVYVKCYEEC
jgi:hypothetical protein